MADVRGRFITLGCTLMATYKDAVVKADAHIKRATGLTGTTLEPDAWYSASLFDYVCKCYIEASLAKDKALVTYGRMIYPSLKRAGGLPAKLTTPLELVKFEAEGFRQNHRGPDVRQREFRRAQDRDVLVFAPAPGYPSGLYEGVFLGILDLCGVKSGKVVNQGNDLFHITW